MLSGKYEKMFLFMSRWIHAPTCSTRYGHSGTVLAIRQILILKCSFLTLPPCASLICKRYGGLHPFQSMSREQASHATGQTITRHPSNCIHQLCIIECPKVTRPIQFKNDITSEMLYQG